MSTGAQSIRNISILLSNPLTSERRRRDKITGTIGDDLFLNGLGLIALKVEAGLMSSCLIARKIWQKVC